ncbi:prepilin-type N-terminal cleavage/methylation domain-containing protein [Actinocrispum sp. NPDC049592]|uniref:PulJ/GspJ family protein n=1 Tax=Actinocrispum sp. NPDC049592 TaxID=3154835 RepID=UPI00342A5117
MLRPAPEREAGFTLVELLIAIVIIGVITVPLANALMGSLRNTGETSNRLELSHDAQLTAAYFAKDVSSIGVRDYTGTPDASGNLPYKSSIQLNAAYNANGNTCGTAATPNSTVRFLSDNWDNSASPATVSTDIVGYYLSGAELHRIKCTAAATSDVVVAHNVDGTTLSVTCSSTCDAVAVPQHVTIAFTLRKTGVDPYPVSVNGQRRQT